MAKINNSMRPTAFPKAKIIKVNGQSTTNDRIAKGEALKECAKELNAACARNKGNKEEQKKAISQMIKEVLNPRENSSDNVKALATHRSSLMGGGTTRTQNKMIGYCILKACELSLQEGENTGFSLSSADNREAALKKAFEFLDKSLNDNKKESIRKLIRDNKEDVHIMELKKKEQEGQPNGDGEMVITLRAMRSSSPFNYHSAGVNEHTSIGTNDISEVLRLKTEVDNLNAKFDTANNTISLRDKEIITLEDKLGKKQDEINTIKDKKEELDKKIEELKLNIENNQKQIVELNNQIINLEQSLTTSQEENKKNQDKINDFNEQIHNLTDKNKKLEEKNSELEGKRNTLNSRNEALQNSLKKLNEDFVKLQGQLETKDNIITGLNGDLKKINGELEATKQANTKLVFYCRKLESHCVKLTEHISQLREHIDNQQKAISDNKEKISQLRDRNEALDSMNNKQQAELAKNKQEISKLEKKNQELQNDNSEQYQQIKRLENEKQENEKLINELNGQIEHQKLLNDKLQQEYTEKEQTLNSTIQQLSEEVFSLTKIIGEVEASNVKLEEKNKQLNSLLSKCQEIMINMPQELLHEDKFFTQWAVLNENVKQLLARAKESAKEISKQLGAEQVSINDKSDATLTKKIDDLDVVYQQRQAALTKLLDSQKQQLQESIKNLGKAQKYFHDRVYSNPLMSEGAHINGSIKAKIENLLNEKDQYSDQLESLYENIESSQINPQVVGLEERAKQQQDWQQQINDLASQQFKLNNKIEELMLDLQRNIYNYEQLETLADIMVGDNQSQIGPKLIEYAKQIDYGAAGLELAYNDTAMQKREKSMKDEAINLSASVSGSTPARTNFLSQELPSLAAMELFFTSISKNEKLVMAMEKLEMHLKKTLKSESVSNSIELCKGEMDKLIQGMGKELADSLDVFLKMNTGMKLDEKIIKSFLRKMCSSVAGIVLFRAGITPNADNVKLLLKNSKIDNELISNNLSKNTKEVFNSYVNKPVELKTTFSQHLSNIHHETVISSQTNVNHYMLLGSDTLPLRLNLTKIANRIFSAGQERTLSDQYPEQIQVIVDDFNNLEIANPRQNNMFSNQLKESLLLKK